MGSSETLEVRTDGSVPPPYNRLFEPMILGELPVSDEK
jgi:hypothetical protein